VTLSEGTLTAFQVLTTVAGAAYAVLAARRNRLCWIAGAIGAALLALLSALQALPMQAALNVFYVGMSVYGWLNWTRASTEGSLPVGWWPWQGHLVAAAVLVTLSFFTAHWLAERTEAEWPLLDSLATWFSLFATWLAARARIENWIYWIVIDGVLVYLYYMQGLPWIAAQFVVLVVIAAAGLVSWRRRFVAQGAPA
jgi:nicotinamide mononucleotide transporter